MQTLGTPSTPVLIWSSGLVRGGQGGANLRGPSCFEEPVTGFENLRLRYVKTFFVETLKILENFTSLPC